METNNLKSLISSNDNGSPPPLPPHNKAHWRVSSDNGNDTEDYKPPIPPHRNTSNGLTRMPDTPKRRHHQRANSSGDHGPGRRHESSSSGSSANKHHHHRASKSSRSKSNGSAKQQQPLVDVVNENSNNADLAFVEVSRLRFDVKAFTSFHP